MEIIAQEGIWLTQATINNDNERGFWKRMHLAYSLTENDFVQWSDEEKLKWEEEHPQEIDNI